MRSKLFIAGRLRLIARDVFDTIDILAVPTAPNVYTVDQVMADPVQLNSRLGTYTNFVNLLDLCGLALPGALHQDGAPSGITLLAPAGDDALLASVGRVFHSDTALPARRARSAAASLADLRNLVARDEVVVAVVGAHMSGMPLNGELKALGARFLERCEDGAGLPPLRIVRRRACKARIVAGCFRHRRGHRG